ncbi:glutamate receptor ionotropic, delta-1-like, partial [Aphidius gifuensis]|uniref:glutamate receptor ionotropic, delta-1-like n=1 Tax=Aphidius gifuensis TaxID=684658 RepID=UPI001CDB6890
MWKNCQLIRPNHVYEQVITGVHHYYNNTCIILMHATKDPIDTQGLEATKNLMELQAYLSKKYIRTAIMEISIFISKVGQSYYHIKRPLFVFLNDNEETKQQFSRDVAPWIDMSYPNWLVFMKNETNIDDYFDDIYVQFDCTFMTSKIYLEGEIITEVYQIDRGAELRKNLFATWNHSTGILTPKLSLYQRRNNLFGHTFRVMSIEDPPQSMISRNIKNEIIGFKGFFGGVIELLQKNMNCTIIYQDNDEWGYELDNGSWTGMIGSLINNKTDIVAAELMMTAERLDAIKFTTPLYSTKIRAFIKRPSSSPIKWAAYYAPFSMGPWSILGISILVTGASISFVKYIEAANKINDEPASLTDTILGVFGALCGQGMEASSLDPIRIIHFVIHMCGLVILAAYSAALISSLAVKTFVMPFTTMKGLLQDGTYRFGVVSGSADYSFFQNTSDEVLSVLFSEILVKEVDLPSNYLEGLTKVCDEYNYAFMTVDDAVAQLSSSVNCILVPLDTISQTSIGMGLRPGSPYRGILDSNLLLLRDSGLMQRLLNSDWALPGDNEDSLWSTVGIFDILPLIAFLLISIILCLLCLFIEK